MKSLLFSLPSDGPGRYCLTNDFVDIFKIEVANNVRLLGQFVARNFVGFIKLKSLEPKASSTTPDALISITKLTASIIMSMWTNAEILIKTLSTKLSQSNCLCTVNRLIARVCLCLCLSLPFSLHFSSISRACNDSWKCWCKQLNYTWNCLFRSTLSCLHRPCILCIFCAVAIT